GHRSGPAELLPARAQLRRGERGGNRRAHGADPGGAAVWFVRDHRQTTPGLTTPGRQCRPRDLCVLRDLRAAAVSPSQPRRMSAAAPHPSRINAPRIGTAQWFPYVVVGQLVLIMMTVAGTARSVLGCERRLAPPASEASNGWPFAAAAIMRRCGGRMRIHTFNAMMVPNTAPTWM